MTKPTDEQIEGALIYVGKMRKWAIEEEDNNHLDVIRTALEEYGKLKTVTVKEAELIIHTVNEPYVPRPYILSNESVNRLKAVLQTLGIEITGKE